MTRLLSLMTGLLSLAPTVLLGSLLGSSGSRAEQPHLLPTRDVDITYNVTRPQKPASRERVRWLAAEHLERVDTARGATTIFDRDAHAVTLLMAANRTFRKLDTAPRRALEPEPGATLKQGGAAEVAGSPCTDWSWTEDGETHTICLSADGVMLRLIVDEQTLLQARAVKYEPQKADLFRIPANYSPALAPEGASEP
jgi:hypothetical protein